MFPSPSSWRRYARYSTRSCAGTAPHRRPDAMETIATVLYARFRNAMPIFNALSPEESAELAAAMRGVLEGSIAKHNGIDAQLRADSILAVFANEESARPDHARRALHAALNTVYETAELSKRVASWM